TRLQGDWSSDVCSSDLPFNNYARAGAEIRVLSGTVSFAPANRDILNPAVCILVSRIQADCVSRRIMNDAVEDFYIFSIPAGTAKIGRASCRERVEGTGV